MITYDYTYLHNVNYPPCVSRIKNWKYSTCKINEPVFLQHFTAFYSIFTAFYIIFTAFYSIFTASSVAFYRALHAIYYWNCNIFPILIHVCVFIHYFKRCRNTFQYCWIERFEISTKHFSISEDLYRKKCLPRKMLLNLRKRFP